MQSPVAGRTLECLAKYETLSGLTSTSSQADAERDANIIDSGARFRTWAANLGALHAITDPKSADHRLRHAPAVVKHIAEILDDLNETLLDIEAILSGTRVDQSLLQDGEPDDSGTDDDDPTTELDELCSSLPDLITSLFKVSIFVRKSTTRDRYARAAAANYEQFLPEIDVRHVADKYPKSAKQPWLQNRLGHAITKRRQYLRYVRDHRDKIAHVHFVIPKTSTHHVPPSNTTAPTHPSKAADSDKPTLAPTAASTLLGLEIPQETSYDLDDEAQDDRSHATSFVSSKVSDDQKSGKLKVLNLEDLQQNGKEFECPYCREIVRVRRDRAWKKHVYRDLRAYVCTFEDCNEGLFEDKHSWFRHELDQHRRQWFCAVCTDKRFSSPEALNAHLRSKHNQDHSIELSGDSIIQASSRPVIEIPASDCPLCDIWDQRMRAEAESKGIAVPAENQLMMPLEQFKRHLADHQEQLALFAKTPGWAKEIDSEDSSHRSDKSDIAQQDALQRWETELVSLPEAQERVHMDQASAEEPYDVSSQQRRLSDHDTSSLSLYMVRSLEYYQSHAAAKPASSAGSDALSEASNAPSLVRRYYDCKEVLSNEQQRLDNLVLEYNEEKAKRVPRQPSDRLWQTSDEAFELEYIDKRREIEAAVEQARRQFKRVSSLCEGAGIDPETYHEWQAEDVADESTSLPDSCVATYHGLETVSMDGREAVPGDAQTGSRGLGTAETNELSKELEDLTLPASKTSKATLSYAREDLEADNEWVDQFQGPLSPLSTTSEDPTFIDVMILNSQKRDGTVMTVRCKFDTGWAGNFIRREVFIAVVEHGLEVEPISKTDNRDPAAEGYNAGDGITLSFRFSNDNMTRTADFLPIEQLPCDMVLGSVWAEESGFWLPGPQEEAPDSVAVMDSSDEDDFPPLLQRQSGATGSVVSAASAAPKDPTLQLAGLQKDRRVITDQFLERKRRPKEPQIKQREEHPLIKPGQAGTHTVSRYGVNSADDPAEILQQPPPVLRIPPQAYEIGDRVYMEPEDDILSPVPIYRVQNSRYNARSKSWTYQIETLGGEMLFAGGAWIDEGKLEQA